MTTNISANQYVGTGFPPDEGTKLGNKLLEKSDVDWDDLHVDLTSLPAGLLISAFFNGFLQCIFEKAPNLLDKARKTDWKLKFDFQRDNVRRWMDDFKPVKTTLKSKLLRTHPWRR